MSLWAGMREECLALNSLLIFFFEQKQIQTAYQAPLSCPLLQKFSVLGASWCHKQRFFSELYDWCVLNQKTCLVMCIKISYFSRCVMLFPGVKRCIFFIWHSFLGSRSWSEPWASAFPLKNQRGCDVTKITQWTGLFLPTLQEFPSNLPFLVCLLRLSAVSSPALSYGLFRFRII